MQRRLDRIVSLEAQRRAQRVDRHLVDRRRAKLDPAALMHAAAKSRVSAGSNQGGISTTMTPCGSICRMSAPGARHNTGGDRPSPAHASVAHVAPAPTNRSMVYVGLGDVPRRSYAPVMTQEEDYRIATIEHRLAWIERRLGAPMSVVDHLIAAEMDRRWRQQRQRRITSLRRQRLRAAASIAV